MNIGCVPGSLSPLIFCPLPKTNHRTDVSGSAEGLRAISRQIRNPDVIVLSCEFSAPRGVPTGILDGHILRGAAESTLMFIKNA